MTRRRTAAVSHTAEIPFMKHVMIALGARSDMKIWRQNCGQIPVRDRTGKVVRVFDAGPPNGAADISGIMLSPPSMAGRRIEIELKADGGKRSPEQERWASLIGSAGGVYVLIAYDDGKPLDVNIDDAVAAVNLAIFEHPHFAPC